MKNKFLISCILLQSTVSLLSENRPNIFQAAREGNVEIIKQHLENNENCAVKDEQGNNPLHIAAENGHDDAVKALTAYYDNCGILYWIWSCFSGPTLPNIDEKNNNGDTPLHRASEKGHARTAEILMKKNANKELVNKQELSAAFTAIKKDNPELLRVFVYNGLDPRKHTKGGTYMVHYAMENQKNSIIAYFAVHNAELLNQSGPHGIKPIHIAGKSNNILGLHMLLEKNVDIEATDDNGNTVAHYSAQFGTQEVMEELIRRRADIKKRNNNGDDSATVAIKCKKNNITHLLMLHSDSNINEQDNNGRTYAMNAALSGNNEILKTLLQHNANVTLTDANKKNILHLIGGTNNYEGAQLVLQKNKHLLTNTDATGNQPLFDAMSSDNPKMVELYIAHGALVSVRNNKGETPVFFAVKNNRPHNIEALRNHKANLTLTNNNGEGLVHYGAFFDAVDALKVLKKYGASFSQRTAQGNTAVHSAAKNNSLNALRYFQSIGEHFDYQNNAKQTPFTVGALAGHLETTKLLFGEEYFLNGEVDSLINTFHRSHTYEQKKAYEFIKEKRNERIAECHVIRNTRTTGISFMNEKNQAIARLTEKNPAYILQCFIYNSTPPTDVSTDQLYRMNQHEREEYCKKYKEFKEQEYNAKMTLENQLNVLRLEEERIRVQQLEARLRAEEQARVNAERELIAAERARIQERDRQNKLKRVEEHRKAIEQERQARHTAALEGQHAPIGMQPSAPAQEERIVVDLRPSAPIFDEPEQGNEAPNIEQGVCCIGSNNCTEEQGVKAIPCKNKHTDLICSACLAQIKNSTNLCPLCRTKLS